MFYSKENSQESQKQMKKEQSLDFNSNIYLNKNK